VIKSYNVADVLTALCLNSKKNKFLSKIQVFQNALCTVFCNNVTEDLAGV